MPKLVQINAGRDVNIYGCSGHAPALPPPSVGHSDTSTRVLGALLYNGWRLLLALSCGALALLVFVGSVCLWVLGRSGDILRMSEAALGGAPTRLAFSSVPLRMLGAGNEVSELEGLNQLETDYVD